MCAEHPLSISQSLMSVNLSLLFIRSASSVLLSLRGISRDGRIVATDGRCLATAAKLVPLLRVRLVTGSCTLLLGFVLVLSRVLVLFAVSVVARGGGGVREGPRP